MFFESMIPSADVVGFDRAAVATCPVTFESISPVPNPVGFDRAAGVRF